MNGYHATNTTDTHWMTDINYGNGALRIYDALVIATLVLVSLPLIAAVGAIVWKCLNRSGFSNHEERVLMRRSKQHPLHTDSNDGSELSHLLYRYSSVTGVSFEALPNIPGEMGGSAWPGYRNDNKSEAERTLNVILPFSSVMNQLGGHSPMVSPIERYRKSSGSSLGASLNWSASDHRNSSLMTDSRPSPAESDVFLEDRSAVTSPTNTSSLKQKSKVAACQQMSANPRRKCTAPESPKRNRFYFAWPEQEEEDDQNAIVWSPLLLKLAGLKKIRKQISDPETSLKHETFPGQSPKGAFFDKDVVHLKQKIRIPLEMKSTWV